MQNNHHYYLNLALEQAFQQRGFCAPNPSVGAVIVDQTGNVISKGFHNGPGSNHAEIDALRRLKNVPDNVTMYVTLEPCCHFGKTPPCTTAIIQSGIKRVIYALTDPNPIVSGTGASILRANGVTCEVINVSEIDQFYESYRYWTAYNKPFVTAKLAMTFDGKIGGKYSTPLPLTGAEINEYTHLQRKTHDAFLTTARTILSDDPQLNARVNQEIFAKPLYILDRNLMTPPTARVFDTAKNITFFHSKRTSKQQNKYIKDNVRFIEVDENDMGLDLNQVIKVIGEDGIHDLWIEAGGKCFSSFLTNNLLQRSLIYITPRILGEGELAFPFGSKIELPKKKINWHQYGDDVLCEIKW